MLWGAAALLLVAWSDGGGDVRVQYAQAGSISIRQQVIIRIPRTSGAQRSAARRTNWREGRGPRCIPATRVAGVGLVGENSVDLILNDDRRIRARLGGRCPALDFYRGFYITATEDGRICADRDAIRSRAGAECEIEQFRTLSPVAE
ncbi:hypothetical protein RCO27_06760 [Sphingosinicella sp. LHD-64]|uniref:hypothetical protein n=1 Tax=Sphingosinicella sp. LHD-64 TaxID=3072139 RepID=UPI00280CC93B|nr:hypothetical protein [Sphingosinicella sp. LHD-64]MDQ8755926.1 hypothetical protein [Sphingosinicella sp. LHD-64]